MCWCCNFAASGRPAITLKACVCLLHVHLPSWCKSDDVSSDDSSNSLFMCFGIIDFPSCFSFLRSAANISISCFFSLENEVSRWALHSIDSAITFNGHPTAVKSRFGSSMIYVTVTRFVNPWRGEAAVGFLHEMMTKRKQLRKIDKRGIGWSFHTKLNFVLSMAHEVPNFIVIRKFTLVACRATNFYDCSLLYCFAPLAEIADNGKLN